MPELTLAEKQDVCRSWPDGEPDLIGEALCEMLADPASGVTRITICGAAPRSVAHYEALAIERGLTTQTATSPSLQRGWVRLTRPARSSSGRTISPAGTSRRVPLEL